MGGCCWIGNSVYVRGDKAHDPNFVFSSINYDWHSVNYCFRFDKVSTSYRFYVTTFPDVAHDRDQNSVNSTDQNTLTIEWSFSNFWWDLPTDLLTAPPPPTFRCFAHVHKLCKHKKYTLFNSLEEYLNETHLMLVDDNVHYAGYDLF